MVTAASQRDWRSAESRVDTRSVVRLDVSVLEGRPSRARDLAAASPGPRPGLRRLRIHQSALPIASTGTTQILSSFLQQARATSPTLDLTRHERPHVRL